MHELRHGHGNASGMVQDSSMLFTTASGLSHSGENLVQSAKQEEIDTVPHLARLTSALPSALILLRTSMSSDKVSHEFTGCPSSGEKFELRYTLLREDLEAIDSYPTSGGKISGLTEEGRVCRIICELRELVLNLIMVIEGRRCYLDYDASGLASKPGV